MTPALSASIDDIAKDAIHTRLAPGMAIGVIEDGRVVYARGFGFANLATHAPFASDTESFCGPLTMQFTAAAAMLLVQAGKLKLDDPVTHYVPELAPVANGVTVEQLLAQTSGLPQLSSLDVAADQTHTIKTADLLAAVDKAKPIAAPGAAYANNPLNYLVAGTVVERASGETLSDYLQQQIFVPLVMDHTFLAGDTGISTAHAVGYSRTSARSGFAPAKIVDPAWLGGASGLVTTVDDLAKWDVEMPILLRVDAVRTLFTPVQGQDTAKVGLGWIVDTRAGHRFVWYAGGIPGYDAANLLLPDDHVGVIVLTNADSAGAIGPGLAAHVAERILDLVSPAGTVRLDNAIVARAREWLERLADKQIDRTQLTPAFSTYLSDDFVARQNLAALGKLQAIVPLSSTTRSNGDTLYVFLVRFAHAQYRYKFAVTTNGKIDEILLVG